MTAYVPSGSLVPLFDPGKSQRPIAQGYLTAWNGTTKANTVEVGGVARTDLPSLDGISLTAPCMVLLLPFGSTQYIIVGRIRVP